MRAPLRLPATLLASALVAVAAAACFPILACGCERPEGPPVRGAVLDGSGRGVPSVRLELRPFRDDRASSRTVTSAEGTFWVRGDPDEANYRLYTTPPNGYRLAAGQEDPVLVNANDSSYVIIRLRETVP